jgi:hypothetical protein
MKPIFALLGGVALGAMATSACATSPRTIINLITTWYGMDKSCRASNDKGKCERAKAIEDQLYDMHRWCYGAKGWHACTEQSIAECYKQTKGKLGGEDGCFYEDGYRQAVKH